MIENSSFDIYDYEQTKLNYFANGNFLKCNFMSECFFGKTYFLFLNILHLCITYLEFRFNSLLFYYYDSILYLRLCHVNFAF